VPIILSQRIDLQSEYEDIPFVIYHFPARYINQIKSGDIFIYYQGDRSKKANRYYFGAGVIGAIEPDVTGKSYYASIMEGAVFPAKVPIHKDDGSYYEAIDYNTVRNKMKPPWQSSIRPLSQKAFSSIIDVATVETTPLFSYANIETAGDPLDVLKKVNEKYKNALPDKKERLINRYIDRGNAVVNALKKILGAKCQICNGEGFIKTDGSRYIEAHHITQLALNKEDSLCSDNIILLCPNCHRKLHYGKEVEIYDLEDKIFIIINGKQNYIKKNKMEYIKTCYRRE